MEDYLANRKEPQRNPTISGFVGALAQPQASTTPFGGFGPTQNKPAGFGE